MRVLPAILLACSLAAPPASHATTGARPFSVEELTGHADAVVQGVIESVEPFVEGQGIYTRIRVRVAEPLKGAAGEMATLKLYGGVHGGFRTLVVGAPCMSEGEEVVLFLKANGPDTYDVVNLAEGKFEVLRAADGSTSLRRDLRGIAYMEPEPSRPVPRTLVELAQRVRAAAR